MTDDDYTNLDLETAEQLLIAAGKPELAQALGFHKHGIRNLVQGEWGKSFIASLEGLLVRHVDPLADQIGGLRGATADLQAEFHTDLSALLETVDGLQLQMRESQQDRQSLHEKVAMLRADFTAYTAGSRRAELSALRDRITALEDDKARFEAVELALKELSARIGGALPTEADQEVSAQLRADEAARGEA